MSKKRDFEEQLLEAGKLKKRKAFVFLVVTLIDCVLSSTARFTAETTQAA